MKDRHLEAPGGKGPETIGPTGVQEVGKEEEGPRLRSGSGIGLQPCAQPGEAVSGDLEPSRL